MMFGFDTIRSMGTFFLNHLFSNIRAFDIGDFTEEQAMRLFACIQNCYDEFLIYDNLKYFEWVKKIKNSLKVRKFLFTWFLSLYYPFILITTIRF